MWRYPSPEYARAETAERARALLVAAQDGRIHFAGPPARACLQKYFRRGQAPDFLPPTLRRWLGGGGVKGRPLVVRKNGTRLQARVVQPDADGLLCLLLEEQRSRASRSCRLTAREQEVLRSVRDGLTNAQIAELLELHVTTVKKHLQNIYRKMGVHNRAAAASF